MHKLEVLLRSQKEALEAEVRETAGHAQGLRDQVGQLRNLAAHHLAASEDKLRQMQSHFSELVRWGCSWTK